MGVPTWTWGPEDRRPAAGRVGGLYCLPSLQAKHEQVSWGSFEAGGRLDRGSAGGRTWAWRLPVRSSEIPRRAHHHIREPCSVEVFTAGPGGIPQLCPAGELTDRPLIASQEEPSL